jgi:uncharacterized membrane protein YuzA (DUF378 family)
LETLSAQELPVPPLVQEGVIDLRSWNFDQEGPVSLDGEWKFFWEQLLFPNEINKETPADYIELVSLWNNRYVSSTQLKGQGFATYQAKIKLPKNNSNLWALELPDMYSSYRLFIDGQEVAKNGVVGVKRKDVVAQWLPQTVLFKSSGSVIDIVLHVSNFSHYKGGLNDHIYFGKADQLVAKRESQVITNILLTGGLGIVGSFFIILFLFFKKDRAALYFAALCITWSVRSVFTNLYLIINWFPNFDWELAIKIEYLTLYLTMMWVIMFVSKMFPHDTHRLSKKILLTANGIFIALTVATPASVFTQLFNVYSFLAWGLLGYTAFVVLKALIFGRAGAMFTTISILLGVAMFAYDMLTYRGIFDFNPVVFSVGYLSVFFLSATAIAYQLSLDKPRTAEEQLTYDDLKMRDSI